MSKAYVYTLIILLVGLVAVPVSGDVKTWSMGEGGRHSWDEGVNLTSSHLKLTDGKLVPASYDSTVNIVHEYKDLVDIYVPGKEEVYFTANLYQPRSQTAHNALGNALSDEVANSSWFVGPENYGETLVVDLGATYAVNRVELPLGFASVMGRGTVQFPKQWILRAYELFVNDGSPKNQYQGKPVYTSLLRNLNNEKQNIVEEFETQKIRYFKLVSLTNSKFSISEFRAFGQGTTPHAVYTSKIIDLGEPVNFGRITLKAEIPEQASLALRTKTGASPNAYRYFLKTGGGRQREVSKKEYQRIERMPIKEREKKGIQGDIVKNTEDWSRWSSPYEKFDKAEMRSPGNRRYFQFQLVIETKDPKARPKVSSLEFNYSTPVMAHSLLGEVVPSEVEMGKVDTLDYYVLAQNITGKDTGFDGIEVDTPFEPEVLEVEIDGRVLGETEYEVEVGNEGFRVLFPEQRIDESGSLIRVRFASLITTAGTRFTGRAISSWTGDFPQDIAGGDATETGSGDGLFVSSISKEIIADFSVSPNPFSPNDDGIGDATEIEFTLLQATEPVPVELAIYDLSGQVVRKFDRRGLLRGDRVNLSWNGQDENGNLVSPGMYILRLSVKGDERTLTKTGLIAVVY